LWICEENVAVIIDEDVINRVEVVAEVIV